MAIVDGTTYNPWTGELDKTLSDTYLDSGWLRLDASNDPLTGDLNFSGAYGAYFRDGNTWIYSGGSGSLGLVATSQILMTTNAVQIGKNNNEDISLTFNAASNDGTLTWMEDENYFLFGNDVTLGGNKLTADIGIFASGVTATVPSAAGDLALYSNNGSGGNFGLTLSGAGDNAYFTDVSGDTITFAAGSITSSTGAIDFGNNAIISDDGYFTTDGYGNLTIATLYGCSGIYNYGTLFIDPTGYIYEQDGSTIALDLATADQITIQGTIFSWRTILDLNSVLYVDGPSYYVGINNPTPNYPLDVSGEVYVDGDITTTGDIDLTGDITASGDFILGSYTKTSDTTLNLRTESGYDTRINFWEDAVNTGFSLVYDGGTNKFQMYGNTVKVLEVDRVTGDFHFQDNDITMGAGSEFKHYTGSELDVGIDDVGNLNNLNGFNNKNPFGGTDMYISEVHNFLFLADKRFDVTYSNFYKYDGTSTPSVPLTDAYAALWFNGGFENASCNILDGETGVVTIDFTGKGEYNSNGIVYSSGYLYLSFYSNWNPESIAVRVKDRNGTYYSATTMKEIGNSSTSEYWRITMPGNNYMTELEISVVGSDSGSLGCTALNGIELRLTRPSTNPFAYVDKFVDQKFYKDFSWNDGDNVETASIEATTGDLTTTGDITIDSDTNGLILGADQDMLISSDAPGDINFTSAANTDITATFIGTTNSGQFMWMEDEDYFEFQDTITLADEGRVTKSIWIPFDGLKAPGTKPATYVDHGISGAWEFSDATDDTIVANIKFPEDMDMTVAPTMCVGWSTNTAVTSETAVWQLEYLYTQAGEDTTAAAQATITVNSNAIAQADGLIVVYFPAMDTPNASDVCVHIRIKRLGADGDDDLTDTAELHGIAMTYTMNKLGTAT